MSGDVERDAEMFDEKRYPPHLRRPPAKVLSINQLVSYNMWRARRANDWSQQDVAELLEKYTGRAWSNASVSAAERAWQGGRPRRFDASEIVALSKIFDEPIMYFFMPDERGNYYAKHVGMTEFPDGAPNMDPDSAENDLMSLVPVDEYVQWIAMYQPTPAFVFRVQELTHRFLYLGWEPPQWKSILKHVSPLEEEGLDWGEVQESLRGEEEEAARAKISKSDLARRITQEVRRTFEEHSKEIAKRVAENVARELLTQDEEEPGAEE